MEETPPPPDNEGSRSNSSRASDEENKENNLDEVCELSSNLDQTSGPAGMLLFPSFVSDITITRMYSGCARPRRNETSGKGRELALRDPHEHLLEHFSEDSHSQASGSPSPQRRRQTSIYHGQWIPRSKPTGKNERRDKYLGSKISN